MRGLSVLAVVIALCFASTVDAACRGKLLGSRRGSCGAVSAAVARTRTVTRVFHRGGASMSYAPAQRMPAEAVPAPKKTK